jgi:hypothetical protein
MVPQKRLRRLPDKGWNAGVWLVYALNVKGEGRWLNAGGRKRRGCPLRGSPPFRMSRANIAKTIEVSIKESMGFGGQNAVAMFKKI